MEQALPQLRQLFERLPAASATADADARFEHFCGHVWPQIKEASAKGGCKYYLFQAQHIVKILSMCVCPVAGIRVPLDKGSALLHLGGLEEYCGCYG